MRFQEIDRELRGAAERAAEQLAALGLTADEAGEFITGATVESDWSDYFEAGSPETRETDAST